MKLGHLLCKQARYRFWPILMCPTRIKHSQNQSWFDTPIKGLQLSRLYEQRRIVDPQKIPSVRHALSATASLMFCRLMWPWHVKIPTLCKLLKAWRSCRHWLDSKGGKYTSANPSEYLPPASSTLNWRCTGRKARTQRLSPRCTCFSPSATLTKVQLQVHFGYGIGVLASLLVNIASKLH